MSSTSSAPELSGSVYTEKKRIENLDRMHNNPVKRRLVASPAEWPGQGGGSTSGEIARCWSWTESGELFSCVLAQILRKKGLRQPT
jgi:hypothetical protein